jgi:hypothetical protein
MSRSTLPAVPPKPRSFAVGEKIVEMGGTKRISLRPNLCLSRCFGDLLPVHSWAVGDQTENARNQSGSHPPVFGDRLPSHSTPRANRAARFPGRFLERRCERKGLQLLCREIRTYQGKQAEILSAYAAQSVKDAGPIQVVFIENSIIPADENSQIPLPLRALQAWVLPPGAAEQPLYMVYIFKSDQTISCP